MSTFTLSMLFLFTTVVTTARSTVPIGSTSTEFIKVSCSATLYPTVCVQSLLSYANEIQQSPKQLAQAALSVSLARAKSAKTSVTQMSKAKGMKPREYGAIKDCVENMGDSVDRLSKSVEELAQIGQGGQQEFIWHMSNVQTWVSAALTDENTCMDGFAGRAMDGKVKTAVTSTVASVAQVTSNALALINQFADTH